MGRFRRAFRVAAVGVALSLVGPSVASADLVGFYQFEGNVLDSSAMGNDGTNIGATFGAGLSGQGAVFNGVTSQITLPINISPSFYPQITFGAWVDVSIITSPNANHVILSGDNGGFDRALTIDNRNTTGGAVANSPNYSAFDGNSQLLPGSPASIADGWVFVAVTYDQVAGQTNLYVDGNTFSEAAFQFGASGPLVSLGSQPNGGEKYAGVMDNVFIYDRVMSSFEIGIIRDNGAAGIQAFAVDPLDPPGPDVNGELWSMDFNALGPGTGVLKSGVEVQYGHGGVWNTISVPQYGGTSVNPSKLDMVNSDGDPTDVDFEITGTVSGWASGDPADLQQEYLLVGPPAAPNDVTWQISGLDPNGVYEFIAYGGIGRQATINVDVAGDGLGNDTAVLISATIGHIFSGISPDANGIIHGSFLRNGGTGESNWSGFQLRNVTPIPEPSSLALAALAAPFFVAAKRRRRMKSNR